MLTPRATGSSPHRTLVPRDAGAIRRMIGENLKIAVDERRRNLSVEAAGPMTLHAI